MRFSAKLALTLSALTLPACLNDPTRWLGVWEGDTAGCVSSGIPVEISILPSSKDDPTLGELYAVTTFGFPTGDSMACQSDPVDVDLSGDIIQADLNQSCGGTSLGYALTMNIANDGETADATIGIPLLLECTVALAKTADSAE